MVSAINKGFPEKAMGPGDEKAHRQPLTKDAELVQALLSQLGKEIPRIYGCIHALAGWDRDRYAVALMELHMVGNPRAGTAR
jgi:hypothetical protein